MENPIPGRNLPVLNFAYPLPEMWTDRQVCHVNCKQPLYLFPVEIWAIQNREHDAQFSPIYAKERQNISYS